MSRQQEYLISLFYHIWSFCQIKLSIPVHWTVFGQLQKDFNCEPVCQPIPEQFQDEPNEWKREIKRMCHSKTWPELGLVAPICLASTKERVSCTIENLDLNSIRHTDYEEALHTDNKNVTLLKYLIHMTSSSLRSTGIILKKYLQEWTSITFIKNGQPTEPMSQNGFFFWFTFHPKIAASHFGNLKKHGETKPKKESKLEYQPFCG